MIVFFFLFFLSLRCARRRQPNNGRMVSKLHEMDSTAREQYSRAGECSGTVSGSKGVGGRDEMENFK
jgi:hypothetical protein